MKKILIIVSILLFWDGLSQVNVTSGKVHRLENFQSKFIDARNVDVWLPDGYSENENYAVLYMHDGQMLYDATTSWNKTCWEADETAGKLQAEGKTKKFIVVGIWNNGTKRHPEYFPQKPFENLTQVERDSVTKQLQKAGRTTETFQPYSDLYLKFLVKELKPYIDKTFSTKKDKNNTFIAGSSMGGLISMYALCEYPKVFGGAACLSTHWPGTFTVDNNPIPNAFLMYLKSKLSKIKKNKIYFDCGDQTLDALYPPLQQKVDVAMKENGFTESNWMTRFFPGTNHSETAWAARLEIPLVFLLGR
jgi:predicted alpha/beta superfamily hydrolase